MTLPLEKQVTSLELSKRMKELGFPQDSLFYWIKKTDIIDEYVIGNNSDLLNIGITPLHDNSISAYTVAECGEMLPAEIDINDRCYSGKGFLIIEPERIDDGVIWEVYYRWTAYSCVDDTEADARAKMLCYLKEKNLI